MNTKERLIIAFKGLSLGLHEFEFSLSDDFFQSIDYSEFQKGKATTKIQLTKRPQYLEMVIDIDGEVEVTCDRCLENFFMPFEYSGKLYVKFNEEIEDVKIIDELIVISPADSEVDLTHYVYESICLSIPYQRIHPKVKGKNTCNKDMLKYFKELAAQGDNSEETDPRWDKLKNL